LEDVVSATQRTLHDRALFTHRERLSMATAKKKSSAKKSSAKRGSSAKKSSAKKSSSAKRGSSAKKSTAKKSASKKRSGAKRTPNAAFMKAMQPSPQLGEVVGSSPMPRTEITKKLWAYIKRNNLQDAKERRMINADDRLRPIFKKDQVSMFDMTKLVNKHLS
jgi:chromatin remodeling complex protein RSC6